jgi:hypothetical protein
LTSPHDRVTSSCWRSRQNQFQHRLQRHQNELFHPTYHFLSASQSDTHRVCNTQKGTDTLTSNGPTHVLAWAMKPISYARHRFSPDVIRHAVWLYLRFTLSYRDVEDLLAERGLTVSNESIRRWVLKFGPVISKNLRGTRPVASR